MCKKHQSVYDDHISYVKKSTPKTFKVIITNYTGHVNKMFELVT